MTSFTARGLVACLWTAVLCFNSVARSAEPAEPVGELTLPAALAATLRANPELALYDYDRRDAEAERLQAGLYPNPALSLGLENFAGNGEVRGTRELETTLALSQLVDLAGVRGRRRDVASAALAGVDAGYVVARLDVLAETQRRFVGVVETQAQVDLTWRSAQLALAALDAAQRRVDAGATSSAEINRARVALERARLETLGAKQRLETARVALAAMWGGLQPRYDHAAADLYALPQAVGFSELERRFRESPLLARFATERRLREAEVKLAQAEARPNPTVGVGIRRLNASDDQALVFSLSLPLPAFNRNQGAIAAAQARAQRTDVERDAAFLRERAVLYGLYRALTQARTESETIAARVLPEAEQALTLIARGYRNGRFSFLELVDAQKNVLELAAARIRAAADAHRLLAEIERLAAEPATAPSPETNTP